MRFQVHDESVAVLTLFSSVTLLFSATNPLSPNCKFCGQVRNECAARGRLDGVRGGVRGPADAR